MRRETATRGHPVVVDDAQGPEPHVVGIVIMAEREGVPAVEPAEVCATAIGRPPDLELHDVLHCREASLAPAMALNWVPGAGGTTQWQPTDCFRPGNSQPGDAPLR